MTRVAEALAISRPHLAASVKGAVASNAKPEREGDSALLERIRVVARERPTNGYRRVCARLNRKTPNSRVNHKRIYRLMRGAKLLLAKHGILPERPHEGKVITLKSDVRWCSDGFEIRCWNGEKVHVVFSLDCCDREAIAWVARDTPTDGGDVRDLMAQTIEARFGATSVPRPLEWLSDNGPPYTAKETRAFGKRAGLLVRNTPSYSPESNGMAEAFVKTFKRDYVYLASLKNASSVLDQLPAWFLDYNEQHPHRGLKMLSPRQFRKSQTV